MFLVYLILGFLIIMVAAVLQVYCEFGRQARPDIKPKIFKTAFRYSLEALWIILMLGGASLLFFIDWRFGIAGIVIFWLVLPFIITPIMRNRILPPWDEVKAELEPKGYNEKNYWRGDWWMRESKQKKKKN